MNNNYYDWNKTFSYDADVTMVVGGRGIGKTFGLRCQFVRDYLKNGYRFVNVCRYKNEIPDIARGYFDRVCKLPEFHDYEFKYDGKSWWISPRTEEKKKDWKRIGYAVSLTEVQKSKQTTFDMVRRIVLDEAIIDRLDKYHRYLPHEFELLANVVDSCSRERPDETETLQPRVYLLGNAVDLINPYFQHMGINEPPAYGYRWYCNKNMLLHYVESGDYALAKRVKTVAGRMLEGTESGRAAAENVFQGVRMDYIMRKPKGCIFDCGVIYHGERFGVWWDNHDCYFYIDERIPRNTNGRPVYALTRNDNTINALMVRRSNKSLQSLVDLAMQGMVYYDSVSVRERFFAAMSLFGIR